MIRLAHLVPLMIFCLFAGLGLAGCTSLNDKAEKLMQEKSYEDAERIYQQILRQHPQDVDAIVGLKRAREGAISSELLLVRRDRLSGNSSQAFEQLKSILERLQVWQIFPTGAVAFTQNEEIDYAVRNLSQQTGELLSQNHPLKAAYLLDRYQDFFQEKNFPLLDRLHKNAAQLGLTHCRQSFASTPQDRGYYLEFLVKECRFWGETRVMLNRPISHGLIGHLDLNGAINELPSTLTPVFEKALNEAIEQSPWYEPTSLRHVELNYRGQFAFQTSRRSTMFTQAYEEEVPYTSSELVTKTRSELRPATRMLPGPNGTLTPQTMLENEEVPYTEFENVTRMRSETRYFYYPGLDIEQTISLDAAADLLLPGKGSPAHLTGSSNDRNVTTESVTEVPRMNLYRKIAKIYEVNYWSIPIIEAWRQQIISQLHQEWSQTHCSSIQASTNLTQQADEVFACLRDTSQSAPPAADAWLNQHLGLPSLELKTLLM